MSRIPADLNGIRVIEIGRHADFKSAFPERTQLLWTDKELKYPLDAYPPFTLRSAWRAWRDVRSGKIDLIVVWAWPDAPWNFRQLKAVIARPFRPLASLIRIFGIQMLRFVSTATPIIVIDNEDPRTIPSHNVFLIDKAKYFFKRELPVDRWQVFQHTKHAGLPGARFRSKAKNRRRIEKLRPISIGVLPAQPISRELPFPEKTVDVFVAVLVEGRTTVRIQGIQQLRALALDGIAIDFADQYISSSQYMERMAKAWLTWSPEGYGWDCFRHYEAPIAYSVPLINSPTIIRYAPLIDRVHALYYQPDDPESLVSTIKNALSNRERLREMAQRARTHVLAHHVRPRPHVDMILRMALGLDEAPGGVQFDAPGARDEIITDNYFPKGLLPGRPVARVESISERPVERTKD